VLRSIPDVCPLEPLWTPGALSFHAKATDDRHTETHDPRTTSCLNKAVLVPRPGLGTHAPRPRPRTTSDQRNFVLIYKYLTGGAILERQGVHLCYPPGAAWWLVAGAGPWGGQNATRISHLDSLGRRVAAFLCEFCFRGAASASAAAWCCVVAHGALWQPARPALGLGLDGAEAAC
jgi:hypothetical protein